MVKPGDEIDNPAAGERIVFRQTAEQTQGKVLEVDQFLKQGGNKTAEHIHLNFDEDYEIIAGMATYALDGKAGIAKPGDKVHIPAGTKHINPWNTSPETLQLRLWVTPEMGTETFYETLYGLARDGKLNANHEMHFWQLIVLADGLSGKTFFTQAPIWLQRTFLPLLAVIGRAMGYKSRYPEYSGPA